MDFLFDYFYIFLFYLFRDTVLYSTYMSRALASARQRRAGTPSSTPETTQSASSSSSSSSTNTAGLTLPQVISLIDSRLSVLEKFMNDTKGLRMHTPVVNENITMTEVSPVQPSPVQPSAIQPSSIQPVLDEYNNRFMMLAEEIGQMKDTLMKLQSYTMDVNKMLLDERVNVLSDLGSEISVTNVDDNIEKSNSEEKETTENAGGEAKKE
jgi:hypothetical protein